MKTLSRLIGAVLVVLLVSCGGGDQQEMTENNHNITIQSSSCGDDIILIDSGPGTAIAPNEPPDPTPSATPVNLKLDFDLMSIQGTELYAGEAILYPN